MIRAVAFASCYVYSPGGTCAISERSRVLRALIKTGDARFIFKYALRVRQQASELPLLTGFFDATDVLVPVPGSEAWDSGVVSVTEHLAAALVRAGLGQAAGPVCAGLERWASPRLRLRESGPPSRGITTRSLWAAWIPYVSDRISYSSMMW